MKPLPLRDEHLKLGAQFVEVAGWEVPLSYGDVTAEYHAVRGAVGIADLSYRGKIRVTGEDRVKWLQSIISNDLLPLSSGHGVYSSLLTHKGKMLTYFRVYVHSDRLLIEDVGEIGETTFQALRKFLLYGTKAKMDQAADLSLLLVSGPRTERLITAALGTQVGLVGQLAPLSYVMIEVDGHQAWVIRTEETGELDIEILVPVAILPTLWARLWEVGASLGAKPFGAEAREILRVEAGLPRAGVDLTEEIVPPEANLEGKAFSLSKGCYPGQEVVARMDTYGSVRRRMVGLLLSEPVVPPRGAKLYSGDREVGWVSSAARSPEKGRALAIGFPLRDFSAPGTPLAVEIDGGRHEATVQQLPFYSRHDG
jgi:glycine cleavage system T protein (aminomethyltransferase)